MNRRDRFQAKGWCKRMGEAAGERGAVLIAVIIAVTVASGLGAAVLNMTSSSTHSQVVAQDATRAQYVAEGGMQYVVRQVQNDINEDRDPNYTVDRLHTKVFPLGDQSFEVVLAHSPDTLEYTMRVKGIINQQGAAVTTSQSAGYTIKLGGCEYTPPDEGGGGTGPYCSDPDWVPVCMTSPCGKHPRVLGCYETLEEAQAAVTCFGKPGWVSYIGNEAYAGSPCASLGQVDVLVCETNHAGNHRTRYCFSDQDQANQMPRQHNWRYWGVTGGEGYQGPYGNSPCATQGIDFADASCTGAGSGGGGGGEGGGGGGHGGGGGGGQGGGGHGGGGDGGCACTETMVICHKPGTPAEKTKRIPAHAWHGHKKHGDTQGGCDVSEAEVCHTPPDNPLNVHTIWVPEDEIEEHLAKYEDDTPGPCEEESTWVEEEWCVESHL